MAVIASIIIRPCWLILITIFGVQSGGNVTKNQILDYLEYQNTSSCARADNVGGIRLHPRYPLFKGFKSVCLDEDIGPTPGNCTVYSLRLRPVDNREDEAAERSFEDAMELFGCQVISSKNGNLTDNLDFNSLMKELLEPEPGVVIDYLFVEVESGNLSLFSGILHSGILSTLVRQLNTEVRLTGDESLEVLQKVYAELKYVEDKVKMVRFDSFRVEFPTSNIINSLGQSTMTEQSKVFQIVWYNPKFKK